MPHATSPELVPFCATQVYDVVSEMLALYEQHRIPLDTPTCLRYLELLGLPQVLQPAPPPSPPQQAQHAQQGQQPGTSGPQFSFPRPTG